MAKRVKIPGRLESAETGGIVTGTEAVMDDEKGKTQVVINSEVDAAIINLAQSKQNVLTFDNAPTEDSPNPVTSAGVYTADKVLSDAIEAILLLIPSAASALNKLVDMQTMNSSIATATASFKGTYNLVSDLHLGVDATHEQIGAALDALSLDADNNDYAFVQVPNSATAPTEISKTERYKFNGANWLFEYDLNNSGFTQGQWNAINSGVTSLLVSKLSNLPTNTELTNLLAGKQDNLTFDNVPTAGSPNPVKSGGVYARNNEIVALINALDAAKQDVLTFDNAPVEGSPNPVKSGGVYMAISAVQAAIVALDAEKQNVLTFDSTPTLGSPNPVTSSGIKTELNRIDGNITTLNDLYEALTQSALVVVQPTDTWPVASPATSTIYRVVDRVNTPPQNYSDYIWNGTTMVLMATYDNAIDDKPTAGSNNLVKSGGVYANYLQSFTAKNDTSAGIFWYFTHLFSANDKILLRGKPDENWTYTDIFVNDGTLLQSIVRGQWYLFEKSDFTNNIEFYLAANNTRNFEFISNPVIIDKLLNEPRIIDATIDYQRTTPPSYYYSRIDGNIGIRPNEGSGFGLFPVPASGVDRYIGKLLKPKATDIFRFDGILYSYNSIKGFTKYLEKIDIFEEQEFTSQTYGFIDENGTVSGLGNPDTGSYVYNNFIPVFPGQIIEVSSGLRYTPLSGWGYVWGYSSMSGDNPIKLTDTLPIGAYNNFIDIPEGVNFIKFWGDVTYNPVLKIKPIYKTNSLYDFVVAKDGTGDFTNLAEAVAESFKFEKFRHMTIFVKPGVYIMPTYDSTDNASNRNLSIIGADKNSVIIKNTNGEYAQPIDNACLRLSGNVTLKNLQFIATHEDYSGSSNPISYCVHVDFNTPDGSTMIIENCIMKDDHGACIGIGLRAGFTLKIQDCELYSEPMDNYKHQSWGSGAIVIHDGNVAGNPQKIEILNNYIKSTGDYAINFSNAYGNSIDGLFIGNALFCETDKTLSKSSVNTINPDSCLNNNLSY